MNKCHSCIIDNGSAKEGMAATIPGHNPSKSRSIKMPINKPEFSLGQMLATISVLEVCKYSSIDLGPFIERHLAGDWGDVTQQQAEANNNALTAGGVIRSVYHPGGRRIWLVTDLERMQTVAMLPHEL